MKISDLRTKLRYIPETGHLIRVKTGKPVYCEVHKGYLRVRVNGKRFRAHRVCWALYHGYWPDQIDHVNGVRSDNRIENLRNVTATGNMRNKRRDKRNKSGTTGVCWVESRRKWYAKICHEKKQISIGYYTDIQAAIAARKAAEKALGFHENHDRGYNGG